MGTVYTNKTKGIIHINLHKNNQKHRNININIKHNTVDGYVGPLIDYIVAGYVGPLLGCRVAGYVGQLLDY